MSANKYTFIYLLFKFFVCIYATSSFDILNWRLFHLSVFCSFLSSEYSEFCSELILLFSLIFVQSSSCSTAFLLCYSLFVLLSYNATLLKSNFVMQSIFYSVILLQSCSSALLLFYSLYVLLFCCHLTQKLLCKFEFVCHIVFLW